MAKLIILAGLPGTGKTTLARKLSMTLNFFYLRVDSIEAPFAALYPVAGENGEGCEALINLAYENLILGHSVIIDTVNPLHISRAMFNQLSEKTKAQTIQFELKVKNLSLHRSRVEDRKTDVIGLKMPTWKEVINRVYEKWDKDIDGSNYEIWTDEMDKAFETCLAILSCGKSGS